MAVLLKPNAAVMIYMCMKCKALKSKDSSFAVSTSANPSIQEHQSKATRMAVCGKGV
jgi:hypothetical protein